MRFQNQQNAHHRKMVMINTGKGKSTRIIRFRRVKQALNYIPRMVVNNEIPPSAVEKLRFQLVMMHGPGELDTK